MSDFVDKRNIVKSVFPERFKELRKAIGISQEDFAKALGVSRASIGYYESGSRLPDAAFLAILSDMTGCDVEFLLGGNPNMIRNAPDFVFEYDLSDEQYGTLDELLNITSFRDFLCYSGVGSIFSKIDKYRDFPFSKKHGSLVQSVIEFEVTKEFSDVIHSIFSHVMYHAIFKDRDIEEVERELGESLKRLHEKSKQQDESRKKTAADMLKKIAEEKGQRISIPKEVYIEKIEEFRDRLEKLSTPRNEGKGKK